MKRLVVDASTLTSGVASRPGGGTPWLLLLALIDLEFLVRPGSGLIRREWLHAILKRAQV